MSYGNSQRLVKGMLPSETENPEGFAFCMEFKDSVDAIRRSEAQKKRLQRILAQRKKQEKKKTRKI